MSNENLNPKHTIKGIMLWLIRDIIDKTDTTICGHFLTILMNLEGVSSHE